MTIANDTQVRRAPGLVEAEFEDAIVLLDTDYRYVGLSATARRIWELLAEPRTPAAIVTVLTTEYDVNPETCLAEVQAFLEQLLGRAIIELG